MMAMMTVMSMPVSSMVITYPPATLQRVHCNLIHCGKESDRNLSSESYFSKYI